MCAYKCTGLISSASSTAVALREARIVRHRPSNSDLPASRCTALPATHEHPSTPYLHVTTPTPRPRLGLPAHRTRRARRFGLRLPVSPHCTTKWRATSARSKRRAYAAKYKNARRERASTAHVYEHEERARGERAASARRAPDESAQRVRGGSARQAAGTCGVR